MERPDDSISEAAGFVRGKTASWICALVLLGACTSGDISADVFARNVLGSYTATVSNSSDSQLLVLCTVTASTGDTDTFPLTLRPGETVEHQGKMSLSDFTDDLEIGCT
jgi:major membrane immunogen (membrane-anchored lipoprotein)